MKKIFSYCLLGILAFTACNKSDDNKPAPPLDGKTKIGEVYTSSGIKVTLWSDTTFMVGYNKVYFTIEDSATGNPVKNASTTLMVTMGMDTMTAMHVPVEQPVFSATNNVYTGATVFTMPSVGMQMGDWRIMLNFNDPNTGELFMALFDNVTVLANSFVPVYIHQGSDGNHYIITLLQPMHPQMGMNDMELLIDKSSDGVKNYESVDNMEVQLAAQMPSMGGMTSSGNVDPTLVGNGHYKGKVNFDMTGDWEIDLKIQQSGNMVLDDAHFNFTF